MGKLLPCPFCGSDDLRNDGANRGIGCRACGAWMPSVVSTDKGQSHNALDGWNRRVDTRNAALEEAARVIESVLEGELPIPNPKRLEIGPYCAAAIRALKEEVE